jgi:hypothetical protein
VAGSTVLIKRTETGTTATVTAATGIITVITLSYHGRWYTCINNIKGDAS